MNPKRTLEIVCVLAVLACPAIARADTKAEKRDDLAAQLEANEHRSWDAFVKKDANAYRTAMEAGALNIDPNGVMSVAQVVSGMPDYNVTGYTFDHTQLLPLDGDVVALIYTAHMTGTWHGQPLPDTPIYATTVYKRHGNTWIGMLHQESFGMTATTPVPATTH